MKNVFILNLPSIQTKWSIEIERERIITAALLDTTEGRVELAQAMVAPILRDMFGDFRVKSSHLKITHKATEILANWTSGAWVCGE